MWKWKAGRWEGGRVRREVENSEKEYVRIEACGEVRRRGGEVEQWGVRRWGFVSEVWRCQNVRRREGGAAGGDDFSLIKRLTKGCRSFFFRGGK